MSGSLPSRGATGRRVLIGLVFLGVVLTQLDAGAEERPNVLIVTVDTLRPDALGWVEGKGDTPAIDRLAATSRRFPSAVSPVPITLPAHGSIFTGRLPRSHGVRDNGQTLPSEIPTLAEALSAAGYATSAFVSGFPLQRIFGLDRGFDHYDDSLLEGDKGWLERRAPETTAAALAWLSEAPEPWFVWIHYYDPHDPYDPPRSFWRPGPRGSYDGEVSLVDHSVGELLGGIRGPTKGGTDPLVIFTADHGEALGEHEESTHGYFLYDSTIRVPLLIQFPGRIEPGTSDDAARLIDLTPTVLDLLGLPALDGVDGRSLAGSLVGTSSPPPLPSYVETQLPWVYFGWSPLEAVVHDGWKLIVAPRPELYDLRRDPEELDNVIDRERPRARELIAHLREIERKEARSAVSSGDPDTLDRLRALGYVGSGSVSTEVPDGLPDPKDRIEERRTLLAGEDLLRAGRFVEAVELFDRVLEVEPDNRYATIRSGIAALEAGQVEEAVQRLARAVELDPSRAEARYAYADALMRSDDPEAAAQQWMELARLQPRRFEAWFNLGQALMEAGDDRGASESLERAVGLNPEDASVRLTYARALGRSGQKARAQEVVQSLLEHDPELRRLVDRDEELRALLRWAAGDE